MLDWQVTSGWLNSLTIPAWCCRSNSAARESNFLQVTPSSVHWERTMSIFGKIMGAIFGTKADAAPAGGAAAGGSAAAGGGAAAGTSVGSAAPAAATVDVAPILDKAVAAKGEKLAWRTSIVDLMKALDIDSSF